MHQPQAGQEPLHRSCLLLRAEEISQHSQQLCEEAADAQDAAKDMVRMSWLARQRRQSEQVERALWREGIDT